MISNPAHTTHLPGPLAKMPSSTSDAAGDPAGMRSCELNDALSNKGFVGNVITTGKYSLLSFVPVSLFAQ